jgi:small subunit ribosomal protein S3
MTKIKKYFLGQALLKAKIDEYLAQNFYEAGYADVHVVKTGLGTRVHIYAERPALIIGRGGSTIRELQRIMVKVFNLENPQITVSQPELPELNARVQAFRIARLIERGFHFRRVAFTVLRRVMANGAQGVEITISGKLVAERARFEKYKEGKVYKAGHVVEELVDRAVAYARLPKGVIGVEVIIAKPGTPPDHIAIKEPSEVKEVIAKIREEVESKKLETAKLEEIEALLEEEEEEEIELGEEEVEEVASKA